MLHRISLIAVFFMASLSTASADDAVNTLVERWYNALTTGDRQAFSELLSDDATILLEDLELEQTKAEFLESLDEWENAMRGSTITHHVEKIDAAGATVLVCYRFPSNELFGRDSFRVANGKITESAQSSIGETCDVF